MPLLTMASGVQHDHAAYVDASDAPVRDKLALWLFRGVGSWTRSPPSVVLPDQRRGRSPRPGWSYARVMGGGGRDQGGAARVQTRRVGVVIAAGLNFSRRMRFHSVATLSMPGGVPLPSTTTYAARSSRSRSTVAGVAKVITLTRRLV